MQAMQRMLNDEIDEMVSRVETWQELEALAVDPVKKGGGGVPKRGCLPKGSCLVVNLGGVPCENGGCLPERPGTHELATAYGLMLDQVERVAGLRIAHRIAVRESKQ